MYRLGRLIGQRNYIHTSVILQATVNPYYEAYAQKLNSKAKSQGLQCSQDLFTKRIKSHSKSNTQNLRNIIPRLDSYLELQNIRNVPNSYLLENIWNLRHSKKPNWFCATIDSQLYNIIEERARKFPFFLVPLKRAPESTEFHFIQWAFPDSMVSHCLITPLIDYKLHQEYATPHTTMSHHLELRDCPNLNCVLLHGEFDPHKNITASDAVYLAQTVRKFYASKQGSIRIELLENFNSGNLNFDYDLLVAECDKLI